MSIRKSKKAAIREHLNDIIEVTGMWFGWVGAIIAANTGNWFALIACVWLAVHTHKHWDND